MGILVTFEGGEGSGKTTQIKLLKNVLDQLGYTVYITREPGGTPISDKIRALLLDRNNKGLLPLAELFLYEASRVQHVEEFIKPTIGKSKKNVILCDRFYDASTAYQGAARNLGIELVEELNKVATGGLEPDISFLIDIDPEIGVKRAQARMKKNASTQDRFELEKLDFHRNVRDAYLQLAQKHKERIVIIDGTKDIETIHTKILEKLKCFLTR